MFSYSKIKDNHFLIKKDKVDIGELILVGVGIYEIKRTDGQKIKPEDDLHKYVVELSRKDIWKKQSRA